MLELNSLKNRYSNMELTTYGQSNENGETFVWTMRYGVGVVLGCWDDTEGFSKKVSIPDHQLDELLNGL